MAVGVGALAGSRKRIQGVTSDAAARPRAQGFWISTSYKLTEGAFRGPLGKTARDDKDPVPCASARRSGSRFSFP